MSDQNQVQEQEEMSFEDEFNNLVDGVSDDAEVQEEGQEEEQVSDEPEAVEPAEEEPTEQPPADPGDIAAELEAARREAQEWQHKYNSDLGRTNALQRQIQERDQRIAELEKIKQQKEEKLDVDAITKEFPEIPELVRRETQPLRQEIEQLRAEKQRAEETARLAQKHADWVEVVNSQEFAGWIGQQPDHVRAMMDSNSAAEADWLLSTFKTVTGYGKASEPDPEPEAVPELKQKRERQLQQAQTLPRRGARKTGDAPPEDDFEAAFNFFADK